MKGVLVALRRGIASRRARAVAMGLAVAAAVAFLSGTYVLTDTIDASVRNSAAQASGSASAVITSAGGVGGSLLGGPTTLPAGLVARIRRVAGVSAAAGIAVGYAMPLDSHGHALPAAAALGMSVSADSRLRVLRLRGGHWPRRADQVVVDATTAARLGLTPGSALRIALPGGVRPFTVTGVAGFGAAESLAGASIVGFAPDAAAGLLGTGGAYAAIEVAGGPGASATRLAAQIKAVIGTGYTVRTASQQADHLAGAIAGYAAAIGAVLRAFAVIALLVAALLIANTFTITVAQRTAELALLRCVGASRGQIAWLVLAEAAAIGLIGAVIGLFGGIGLAAGLRAALGAIGLPTPAAVPALRAHTMAVALAVGVGVTMVAAGAAAARASRSRPLTALTGDETAASPGRPGRARLAVAAGALLFGVASLSNAAKLGPVAVGALSLLAGAGLAGPMLVRPLTAPVRGLQSAVAGHSARLAGRQMLRNPRRVVGTAGTLAVAVAAVTIISTVAATSTSNAALDVSRSLRADYIITTPPRAGLSPAAASRVARLPGVARVAGMRCGAFSPPAAPRRGARSTRPPTPASSISV